MARPFQHLRPRVISLGSARGSVRAEALFLHGAWVGPWYWENLAREAAQAGFGVSLLELPGHGDVPWTLPPTTSLNDYADLAVRAVGELGRPILVGHSMGGWLVQKILEKMDLPAALLAPLPGTGLPLLGLARFLAALPGALPGTFSGHPLAVSDVRTARRMFFCDLPESQLQALVARLVPEPARVALEMGLGLARARPAAGRAPRLVLAAGRDFFMPVGAMQSLARGLGASFRLLPRHPHDLWLEDPKGEVADILLEFLDIAAGWAG